MRKKTVALIDIAIQIDYKTIKKLDKMIKKDKELTDDEKHLWEVVHLFPETYTKDLEQWIEKAYGK